MAGEIDDLEDTLKHDPGVDQVRRDRAREMRASPHFCKRLKQRLDDDFRDVCENPPE